MAKRTGAPIPSGGPATPKTIASGLTVWFLYESTKRFVKPFRWIGGQFRRALFGWRDYPKYLREQSVVEGVFNGSKLWLTIGAAVWGFRAWRRATGRTEHVVLREVLRPGERFVIAEIPRKAPRRDRRAARRAS